jgi:hypothetical protein
MEGRAMTELREPVHIDGDAVISFRGNGSACFRIQHARDLDGQPLDNEDEAACARCKDYTIAIRPA